MVSVMLQVRFVPYRPELWHVTLEIAGMKGDSLLSKFSSPPQNRITCFFQADK